MCSGNCELDIRDRIVACRSSGFFQNIIAVVKAAECEYVAFTVYSTVYKRVNRAAYLFIQLECCAGKRVAAVVLLVDDNLIGKYNNGIFRCFTRICKLVAVCAFIRVV